MEEGKLDQNRCTEITKLRQAALDRIWANLDVETGIQEAITIVGRTLQISRIYIFENNEENTHVDNTFEWCGEGIGPRKDLLQHRPFEERDYHAMFDQQGVFFCPDVSAAPNPVRALLEDQSIRATLQYAIYDKGIVRGFVGFDDCVRTRFDWRDDTVSLSTLMYISRILSVCLLKERNLQKAVSLREELEHILEQERDLKQEALLAAEEKSRFLSRMSHDMRTPMNGILGIAALSEDEDDIAVLKDNIRKIKNSGEYLLELINDILDSQKIEKGKMRLHPQVIYCAEFMENLFEIVKESAQEKQIDLQIKIPYEHMNEFVRIDPVRMKQIFLNLLSNAIKFTPNHGTVSFETACEPRGGNRMHVVIKVRDTGIGMSKEYLEHGIFKVFSQEYNQVSAQTVGTGLGLAIVKRLVEMMQGTIEVESQLGKGTTFTVQMDIERVPMSAASKIESDVNKKKDVVKEHLFGKRILLVEDHPLNAEVAKRILQKAGCEVEIMENGALALQQFEQSPLLYYDAILMDIRMPVMDGITAAKEIRKLDRSDAKTITIIAMTANAYDEDIREALDAGMNEHLAKPVEPQKLYAALGRYIRSGHKEQFSFYTYTDDSSALKNSRITISSMKEMIENALEPKGAFAVGYESFQNIYQFLQRNIARTRVEMQILLFTVQDVDEKATDGADLYKTLSEVIQFSLREGDLMIEFNAYQMVVILMNCDRENSGKVAERVLNRVAQKNRKLRQFVSYECCEFES